MLPIANLALTLIAFLSCIPTPTAAQLNVTAISTSHGASVLECWQLTSTATAFAGAENYPLGNSSNGYLGILPPRTYIGLTHALHVQFSLVLSGLVHISIPNCTRTHECEAWVRGGKEGIIIAADMGNVSRYGHVADFPSSDTTAIAQFPCEGNVIPAHVVLRKGPCREGDMLGL